MSQTLIVDFEKPLRSAKILDNYSLLSCESEKGEGEQIQVQDSQAKDAVFSQACQTLNGVVSKLNQFYDRLFAEHREEIARLSVEIARKILMQKVQNGDYEIESIVKEVLQNAPTKQELVIHLNPEDLAACERLQQDDPDRGLADIKFVGDPSIGRAECLLETPKGIVKSSFDEQLERISEALEKV